MSGDDREILRIAPRRVRQRTSNHGSILPKAQRQGFRAAAAQPEVLHFGRGAAGIRVDVGDRLRIGFQPKKSSLLQIVERCSA